MKIKTNHVRLSVYVIAISFIVGFTGVWILPDVLSNLIKPIVIVVLIGEAVLKKFYVDTYGKILFVYLFIVVVCSALNGLTTALFSFLINIMYTFLIIIKKYKDKEMDFLLNSIKYASLVLAAILIISNPLINRISTPYIYLLNISVNKNAIAYLISPGLYVCVQQLFDMKGKNKKGKTKFFYFIELFLLLYAGIYPMSRGGFLCMFFPLFIFLADRYRAAIKKFKIKKIVGGILILCLAVYAMWNLLPKEYVNRLLLLESYTYHNSGNRDILVKQAIELVQGHELTGLGFGYYQSVLKTSYGAHNCFVDMYVNAGLVGLVGLIIIFVYPIIKCKNAKCYSWIVMALIAAFFESQMSYQVWVPLAIAWLIWKTEKKINNEKRWVLNG